MIVINNNHDDNNNNNNNNNNNKINKQGDNSNLRKNFRSFPNLQKYSPLLQFILQIKVFKTELLLF